MYSRGSGEHRAEGTTFASGECEAMLGVKELSAEYEDKLRRAVRVMEYDRGMKDFVWHVVARPETVEFHDKVYTMMARILLRTSRYAPGSTEPNVVRRLTDELFGVTDVGDLTFVPEHVYSTSGYKLRNENSLVSAALHIYNYCSAGGAAGALAGSKWKRARKAIARKALFFVCLHHDLSFLNYVIDPKNGAKFASEVNFRHFVQTKLATATANFLNGLCLIDMYVADCIADYAAWTGVDPYADVPLRLKPPEDPRVLSEDRRALVEERPAAGPPRGVGAGLIGYDEEEDER